MNTNDSHHLYHETFLESSPPKMGRLNEIQLDPKQEYLNVQCSRDKLGVKLGNTDNACQVAGHSMAMQAVHERCQRADM